MTEKRKETFSKVASILDVEKTNWASIARWYKIGKENGFTDEDFIQAAKNMAAGDKIYWSIYSVFQKTDYWLAKTPEPEAPKGIW